MKDAFITLENLAVGYDNRPVLEGISFRVPQGSFTAILGANGSGKSTLLKTLIGIQPPLKGIMRIEMADGRTTFGYVPQSLLFDPLYPLTGLDVAVMGVYGRVGPGRFVPRAERAFVRECLRATGAHGFANRRFAELSGGQKQRILIARALAVKPAALVLDEPTAGVDAASTQSLLAFVSELHERQHLTILLVTHDLPIVRKHAQQVIWLHHGRVMDGTAAELLAPERLAEFLEVT